MSGFYFEKKKKLVTLGKTNLLLCRTGIWLLQGEFLGIKPYKIMTITWLTQNVDFPAELVKADVEPWLEAVAWPITAR